VELREILSRLVSPPEGRWWDLPAALLLLAALITAGMRLVATDWTDHLNQVYTMAFLGVLAGLALGQSRFSRPWTAALGLAYGLFFLPRQLSLALIRTPEGALWTARLARLSRHLAISITQLLQGEPVQDPLLFVFLVSSLTWVLGMQAGYGLTRHARSWRAILPTGVAVLVIQTYDPFVTSHVWYLAVYLLFALLFVARVNYLRDRARWRRELFSLPSYLGSETARVTLQIVAVIVLVAWSVPAIATALSPAQEAWERITRPWISLRDRLENAVVSLRDQVGVVYNVHHDSLTLGPGSQLSDDISLVIEPQRDIPIGSRYYWRARVYDTYADGEWRTTIVSTSQTIVPGYLTLLFPEVAGGRTSAFTITTAFPISMLYIPGQPSFLSRAAQADLAYNPDGTVDIVALHAKPPLDGGMTYRVRTSVNAPTIAQLRSASTDYPAWVTDRYLQLPPNITPRFRELALQFTEGRDNPYDVADALTTYLRRTIQYNEVISLPPSGQEPLDWFLFDYRKGFCNYYASAEVILLRSLGIPARLASGFAQGERQVGSDIYVPGRDDNPPWSENSDVYVVRQRDSHAWPEVYFPGFGWIEFEPTSAQSPLDRPLGEDEPDIGEGGPRPLSFDADHSEPWEILKEEIPRPMGDPLSGSDAGSDARFRTFLTLLVPTTVLIAIAIFWRRRSRAKRPILPVLVQKGLRRLNIDLPARLNRWIVHATLPFLTRAYMQINYALVRLDAPPEPADTPAERAETLRRLLPTATGPAERLLAEYHAGIYGFGPGDLHVARRAGHAIRSLSWKAALRRLLDRLTSRN
jgi:transglutaminase-like putative cysteine protease